MISAVIVTLNDAQRLTATLAALAPAAIDGFVREVIVADGGSADETLEVAEDAGAGVVTTGFAAAITAARQPWLLILAPGSRPEVGWERAAQAHMRDYPDKGGWFDLALPEPGAAARLGEVAAQWESAAFGRLRTAHGLLICNRQVEKFAPIASHEDLIRRVGRARIRRIGARALIDRG
ncbi:MAG TPA: glycosyltransferase [Caulobacteraceae bacterium]|jgi:glycosyltransferase involved in cell wall biosynthesis|nr:glycosyltransferase [Caulobacteraceae bacterium]